MDIPIEWLPAEGAAEQLIVLLHGEGDDASAMLPLAGALRAEFPQAAIVGPDAPQPFDCIDISAPAGPRRQWFSLPAPGEPLRPERVEAALAALHGWVRQTQDRLRLPPVATALAGFSQGAILALETALAHDGLAGRVLAFSGRFVELPTRAPAHTTLHLFHGGADTVVAAQHARDALEALGALRGDATLDVAEEVGHELHPVLLQRALFRLRNHIPARTWAAALGAVPPGTRVSDAEDD